VDDFAYINTRIHAMRGRLLKHTSYDDLLRQESATGVLDHLRDSPYAKTLEETNALISVSPSLSTENGQSSDAESRELIDQALRRDLTWSLSKLSLISAGHPRELIEALLLRWDAYNLKTLIRGKQAAATAEEILALTFPIGTLDEIALATLARTTSLRILVETLETWRLSFAHPVREGLKELEATDSLQPLEFKLDQLAFAQAFQMVAHGNSDHHIVRNYLRLLVDKTNLLTALHYGEQPGSSGTIDAGRYFLAPEGFLTRKDYDAIASASDLRHGLNLLAKTPYAKMAEALAERETLSLIERHLDRMVFHHAVSLGRKDPLGIGLCVAYIEQKVNEVRNIRMIMRAKDAKMRPEQVTEWLIFA